MKNLKIYKILCIAGVSVILVGCQNKESNNYENKTVAMTEESREQMTTKIEKNTTQPTYKAEIESEPIPTTVEHKTEVQAEPNTVPEQSTSVTIIESQPLPTTIEQPTTYEELTTERKYTDEEVIEYIRKLSDDMDECSENIVDSVKSGFITVVDFLFYGGTIGGRTFDSLTDEAKAKVLGLYDTISNAIETKWPVWKENLGNVYEGAKELWNDKKDDLAGLWESGKQKVKTWYENLKDNN